MEGVGKMCVSTENWPHLRNSEIYCQDCYYH